jgi:3-hydroxybutyryl-CoA dehydrogenase
MIKSVCICGCGTMGSGIALAASISGYLVIVYDLNETALTLSSTSIQKQLNGFVERGKISSDNSIAAFNRISFVSQLNLCKADLFIEAIKEDLEIKKTLFIELFRINGSNSIYTSNTSSLSIEKISLALPMPELMAGLHFFNPAPIMKLVELVKTPSTKPSIVSELEKWIVSLNKISVVCNDSPGFIVNRVARPFYIEALRLAEKGLPCELIDDLMESAGFKLGPFRLMDLIGNDINYSVSVSVYNQLNKPDRLKPSYIQEEKVQKNELGRKTGKGYYDYS